MLAARRRLLLSAPAVGACLIALSACGSSGGGSSGGGGNGSGSGSTGPAATIAIGPKGGGFNPKGAKVVPLKVLQGPRGATIALIPVFINGQGPFPFALDTGASQSVIDRNVARRLGLKVVKRGKLVSGVTGRERVKIIHVNDWRIGNVDLHARNVTQINLPEPQHSPGLQGLIGSDILSTFGVVAVDYDHGRLFLKARNQS